MCKSKYCLKLPFLEGVKGPVFPMKNVQTKMTVQYYSHLFDSQIVFDTLLVIVL